MNIRIDNRKLKRALILCSKVAGGGPLEILKAALFESNDGELTVRATDLDKFIRITLDGEAGPDGIVAFPCQQLLDISSALGDGEVTIAGNVLTMGSSRFTLPEFTASDMPDWPDLADDAVSFELPSAQLLSAIGSVKFCAAGRKDPRKSLQGICVLSSTGGPTEFFAANGKIGGRSRIHLENAPNLFERIIPSGMVGMIESVSEESGSALIESDASRMSIHCGNVTLMGQLIAEKYPQYDALIPKGPCASVTFDRNALKSEVAKAATAVHYVTKTGLAVRHVWMEFDDSAQKISISAEGMVTYLGELASLTEFSDLPTIGFAADNLLALIANAGEGPLTFSFYGQNKPVVVHAESEKDSEWLVMPIKKEEPANDNPSD